MTHMRYWAMMLATAICGGFIAIERFAFAPTAATWIAFGVAIAATVFSLAAFMVALMRQNHGFSGLSGLSVLIAAWTIIAMVVFGKPTAIWLAFADGIALLLVSLRVLALHETTVERVVHALERGSAAEAPARTPMAAPAGSAPSRRLEIAPPMRSWLYWLAHTGLVLGGAFIVLMTFALTAPGAHHASPRWIAFGIAIAATCVALGALLERGLLHDSAGMRDAGRAARRAAVGVTTAALCVPVALIVTMLVYSGGTARWIAFALGCGMIGVSLVAAAIHEITSERVRHELEVGEPSSAPRPAPTVPAA